MDGPSRAFLPSLIAATIVACALRFAALGGIPPSLYCDEAFHGWEAYCLLETGRDSRGVALPLFFDIFGKGWGEPLYTYLTVPAVALFGLTPLAARAAAAAAGTLAVPVTGLLAAALLRGAGKGMAERAGIVAAALMAISPWSFHLSRVAFQASLLPLMLAAGFWLAARGVRAVRRKSAWLLLAGLVLGVSLYTYTVARLAMPLLLAGFVFTHRRFLRQSLRPAAAGFLALVLVSLPIAGFTLTEQGRQRFSDVSLLSTGEAGGLSAAQLARRVAGHYLSYYSPRFLLTEGDPNPRHSVRGFGMLHPHDLLLLLLGAAACAAARPPGGLFLLWWLAAFPAAAALTIDERHAVRSICGQPGLYALAGAGGALLWAGLAAGATRPGRLRRAVAPALICLMMLAAAASSGAYFAGYVRDYPVESAPSWQYGLQDLYDYLEQASEGHDSIYITRNEDFPFIHYLFYREFPPREYQAHGLSRTRYLFDQKVFYKGPRIPGRMNPIFVWKPFEVPDGVTVRRIIRYPDGTEAFIVAW